MYKFFPRCSRKHSGNIFRAASSKVKARDIERNISCSVILLKRVSRDSAVDPVKNEKKHIHPFIRAGNNNFKLPGKYRFKRSSRESVNSRRLFPLSLPIDLPELHYARIRKPTRKQRKGCTRSKISAKPEGNCTPGQGFPQIDGWNRNDRWNVGCMIEHRELRSFIPFSLCLVWPTIKFRCIARTWEL